MPCCLGAAITFTKFSQYVIIIIITVCRDETLVIIIKLPDQAIASTPSAPRPPGGRKREHRSIMFATITLIPSFHKIHSNAPRHQSANPLATPNIIRNKTQQLGRCISQ
jgi:hypothetical protein